MATLTVEGVPPGLLNRLAVAAVANGRCVNSEVILSLVRHLREQPPQPPAARPGRSSAHSPRGSARKSRRDSTCRGAIPADAAIGRVFSRREKRLQ